MEEGIPGETSKWISEGIFDHFVKKFSGGILERIHGGISDRIQVGKPEEISWKIAAEIPKLIVIFWNI